MYSIRVEGDFSSAHNLRGYKGKCEKLHGHNWRVEVVIVNKELDKIGMVFDFRLIKDRLKEILEKLDHEYLNKVSYFKRVNPTSENITKYIYDQLNLQLFPDTLFNPDKSLKYKDKRKRVSQGEAFIKSVTVWESHNASATYFVE